MSSSELKLMFFTLGVIIGLLIAILLSVWRIDTKMGIK